jgi:hypothetical protein
MLRPSSLRKAASKSTHHCQKHATIVFRGGAVLAVANNNERFHAEVRALRGLKDASGTVLVSVRVGKDGGFRNAYPCDKCMDYIRARGVSIIHYSSDWGFEREDVDGTI